MADEYFSQMVFTVEEPTTKREAEQLRVLKSRSTETVDKLQPGGRANSFAFLNPGRSRRSKKLQPGGKLNVSEQVMHAPR